MEYIKDQLTLRGTMIGSIGCIIITAASVYTALKLGALPWPIVFAAIISLFFLKAMGKGKVSLNEANVTHTIMSAGAMVAGGLAFTIPAAWMLGYASEVSIFEMLVIALTGVILGLVCTALLRRHFIEEANLEYPIGEAAAQTLIAGNSGGKTGVKLFGAMGFAGIYTALRDLVGVIPSMFLSNITIPGVSFGIYNSPMLLAVGFLVGTGAVVVWFVGALVANFGIIVGGSAAGLWDVTTAQGIVSSLGMGIMMGAGFGVIFKDIIPKAIKMIKSSSSGEETNSKQLKAGEKNTNNKKSSFCKLTAGMFGIAVAAVALLVCFVLGLGIIPTLIVVVLAFVSTAMSAQSVGQTGIDPMEIFGLIVLLAVAAASDIVQVKLFYVAAIVAVACGLAGDVMNDFHAGYRLGTSPQAQWIGQAIGSVLGAFVSVAVMVLLLGAYGPDAFGPQSLFVSAQASVVATFVSGIPSISSLVAGLVLGVVLYFVKFPSMMLGLGIYLPFYMSFSAFLGAVAKLFYDFACKSVERKRHDKSAEKSCENDSASKAVVSKEQEETGLVVASGLLGGESIVGVIAALIVVILGAVA
ncbi:OPT/YSL family transporter [Phoenicibacter congonensis]|uniref:OPT/YSL family transporter n=1 Tax=Phoenicibacter congonensis TaxID=1944646 RepID=UPI0009A642AB|nr:OPT/YSL family transporter [Phoenicibacter congonensis]